MAGINYHPGKEINPAEQAISKPYRYQAIGVSGKKYRQIGVELRGVFISPEANEALNRMAANKGIAVGSCIDLLARSASSTK